MEKLVIIVLMNEDFLLLVLIIIILLMYSGRVGSVSFALIFTRTKKYTGVHNPVEQVSIG